MDHHPEWWCTNGGKTINTSLTSHFAGNKVTITDYKVASEMNRIERELNLSPILKFVKKMLHL